MVHPVGPSCVECHAQLPARWQGVVEEGRAEVKEEGLQVAHVLGGAVQGGGIDELDLETLRRI